MFSPLLNNISLYKKNGIKTFYSPLTGCKYNPFRIKLVISLTIDIESEISISRNLTTTKGVNYLSDGDIDIKMFPAGEWGIGEEAGLQSLQLGTLDLVVTMSANIGLYTDALYVFDIPFSHLLYPFKALVHDDDPNNDRYTQQSCYRINGKYPV